MIKKWFYCQNCDDNPNKNANAMQARANVDTDGTVGFWCFGCGGHVELVDKLCDHEWVVVSSDWVNGSERIYGKCRCGETREGRRFTWWPSA